MSFVFFIIQKIIYLKKLLQNFTTNPNFFKISLRNLTIFSLNIRFFNNFFLHENFFKSILNFSFFRLGEPLQTRGRQTICKFYKSNELLNDQLIRIKSAVTPKDIERIFSEQLRHNQFYPKNTEKSIEPYYDAPAILEPLKTFASESCLCAKEFYRLDFNLQPLHDISRLRVQSNTIKNLEVDDKGLEDFYRLANECYETCIQHYLNDLNDCNRKAEIIARQSVKRPATSCGILKRTLKPDNKVSDELSDQLKKLSINLNRHCGLQSTTNISSSQAMSCNDTNNNSTDSTNLKEPPKIILSDFSSKQQQEHASQALETKSESEKNFDSDTSGKSCLTIPLTNYCSEARPP